MVSLAIKLGLLKLTYAVAEEGENVTLSRRCKQTGDTYSVTLPRAAFQSWIDGEFIQRAAHMLTPEQREFIISDHTPAEWDAKFGGDDDE